jgi:arylsulfatase A-like enzyme
MKRMPSEIRSSHFRLSMGLSFAVLLASLSGCTNDRPMNVLLISLDTLRADRVSSYGGARPTPAIDGLADRGVRFENAFTPSPWTLPAHAAMLSGRYPGSIADDPNSLEIFAGTEILSAMLKQQGYATGAVTGGIYLGKKFGLAPSFDSYTIDTAERNSNTAVSWLRAHADQPFFFFYHTYIVHAPYNDRRYTEGIDAGRLAGIYKRGTLNDQHFSVCCRGIQPTSEEQRFLEGLYDGGVARADERVAELWNALGELGLQDDTLVILTSDHGEELWEHTGRAAYHGHTLYDELLRIPLIWSDPRSEHAGRIVDEPVNLIDLVPTVLARLGFPLPDDLDGFDLTPLIEGSGWGVERVLFAEASRNGPERKSVRAREGKLIFTPRPRRQGGEGKTYPVPVRAPIEFYAADDEKERRNLAEQQPERVGALMKHLEPRLARMPDGLSAGSLEGLDEETRAELRALGYAE